LIDNLKWKAFLMWVLCYEVGQVSKIWGVMFLVVPPKDKFAPRDPLYCTNRDLVYVYLQNNLQVYQKSKFKNIQIGSNSNHLIIITPSKYNTMMNTWLLFFGSYWCIMERKLYVSNYLQVATFTKWKFQNWFKSCWNKNNYLLLIMLESTLYCQFLKIPI
jgi:hypothetical protein